MPDRPEHHSKRRRDLALALAGMNDQQPALLGLGGQHAGPGFLLLLHLFGVIGVALRLGHQVGLLGLLLAHAGSSECWDGVAKRPKAELLRGVQKPRCAGFVEFGDQLVIAEAVVRFDELAHRRVLDEGLEGEVEMMRLHRPGRRGEGEHVVDRRDDLEGALVAVPLHPVDPFGIDHAAAHHPRNLFLERARQRALGARMVVVIGHGSCARSGSRPSPPVRPRTGSSRRSRAGRARDCPGCAPPPRCRESRAAKRSRSGVPAACAP